MSKLGKSQKIASWILAAVAIILGIFIYIKQSPPPNGKYDALAQCIEASGAKFYGAFWCPHCKEQKNEFGSAARYLPYMECSLPDASAQMPACIAQGIKHYPTWIFPDGSKMEGVVTIEELAKRTNCPLPLEEIANTP